MELKIKTFEELTKQELYEILRLRSQVFIVEQQGCYLDLDGIDYDSLHIFLWDGDGRCAACLRLFPKADEPGTMQLGRIVSRNRCMGYGRRLMEAAERIAREQYGAGELYLTGRKSASGFYEKCGYRIDLDAPDAKSLPYYRFRRSI